MLSLWFSVSMFRSGRSAPCWSTKSRHCGLSPAMLPSAQTACSRTSNVGDASSLMNSGTAPEWITTCVFSAVPDAMFVSAHAASNCARAGSARTNGGSARAQTHLQRGMPALEELHEARDDAALDDRLDRRVLLLRSGTKAREPQRSAGEAGRTGAQELAELRRRVELALLVVREHVRDELRRELRARVSSRARARAARAGRRTGASNAAPPSSSSESGAAATSRLRRFAIVSSRFCRRISTCCSSRRRRRSSALRPLAL
jgi:hypothetical protein